MSKYEAYRKRFACVETPEASDLLDELREFDWFNFTSTAPAEVFVPKFISIIDVEGKETPHERKMRMLRELSNTCIACSMCELGLKGAEKADTVRDPHVLSNMNPSKFMVVGQNPGWNELEKQQPFVGAAGNNFDTEIEKHGVCRDWFYIGNTVRCYTKDNIKPTKRHMDRCEPFLRMEIGLLKPKLVITLGAVAFAQLCPDVEYGPSLKKITKSKKFGVPVFAIYHPSPINFRDGSRRVAFQEQIKVMCELIKAIKAKNG
jgi:DNA polymerase